MKVLVDTSVWSLAFRRKERDERNNKIVAELINLIRDLRVSIIGPIRQELLSGISEKKTFEELKEKMQAFTDYVIQTADYEAAAEFSNKCRKNGIQGSHREFLICAAAVRNEWEIFTEDTAFLNYKKHIPIRLYKIHL
ncbi:MAG: PIN domain-containing protein [Spirochaetaceae bacterium]|jgi:predicted nucleic acid-binding protein|nr:PIN domain-containing protein [Spirochaetaceae bacterium]